MSIWLKITLIVFGAVAISFGISLIPAGKLALSAASKGVFSDEPLMKALFVRPPQAAVGACLESASQGPLTHDDFVRVAKCLQRRHFVRAWTVKAVERGPLLGAQRIATLKTKATAASWWWLLTWSLALAAIVLVVYRHLRHRQPPSGTGAFSG